MKIPDRNKSHTKAKQTPFQGSSGHWGQGVVCHFSYPGHHLLFSSSGPLHQFPEPLCGAISLFNCMVCLSFPKGAERKPFSPTPVLGLLFFLSLHPLTSLLPNVISSYDPGTHNLISPSCRAEFLCQPCPSTLTPPLPACLPGFPQMDLPLHAGAGFFLAYEPVWKVATSPFSFVICIFVSLLVALHCSPSHM